MTKNQKWEDQMIKEELIELYEMKSVKILNLEEL